MNLESESEYDDEDLLDEEEEETNSQARAKKPRVEYKQSIYSKVTQYATHKLAIAAVDKANTFP